MSEVITIDGPTSSGKNSVALLFAQRIGYQFVDSGSIYRAFSLALINQEIDPADNRKIADALKKIKIEYAHHQGDQEVILDGEDVTGSLHRLDVTQITPIIAAKGFVRKIAVSIQRKIASGKNTVMTGRDIGSEVFPSAKLKFYLTASPEIRASRRLKQLRQQNPHISYEEVLSQLKERDQKDMTRKLSPLVIPKGAVVIDTTNLTTKQSVNEFMKYL